ncbi:sulfurtransferase complex subunit TusC [Hydrogenophilus islandicus]
MKKFLFVNRKAPFGSVYALESLEVVLITAAFEQEVGVAFLDDGVYQIVKGTQPKGIEMKNHIPAYRVLPDYDIDKFYVERESMEARGLTPDDFVVDVTVLSAAEMGELMEAQDVVLSF